MAAHVNIRRFVWADVAQLTVAFNEINGTVGTESENDVDFMRRYLSQPSCRGEDNAFVAQQGDQLIGFAVVFPELRIGRTVASGGVLGSYRGRGAGRMLLRRSVEHARGLGANVLHVQAPSDDEVAGGLLRSEALHKVRTYQTLRWESDSFEPPPIPTGYRPRPFVLGRDEERLAELQNAAFEGSWGFCPNTTEEVHARVRLGWSFPDGIVMLYDRDRPAAYNWTLRPRQDGASIGWISMTGVHPEYRGKGLGDAVIGEGIDLLRSAGVGRIELEVDSANMAARSLYRKAGFKKVGETFWFERSL